MFLFLCRLQWRCGFQKTFLLGLTARSHITGGLTGQANQPIKHHIRSYMHDKVPKNVSKCLRRCKREICSSSVERLSLRKGLGSDL
jgi:hypothetical protein